jgi:CMP-N-acetylneuraminic acid synthetase
MQTQTLPEVWTQDSSLEMAWRRVLEGRRPTISGERIAPFFTEEAEGFSIDYPEDFERAELMLERGQVDLPRVLEAVT